MTPYVIQPHDVGRHVIRPYGAPIGTGFMGGIRPGDVGKRIVRHPKGFYQVENEGQRAKRLGLPQP